MNTLNRLANYINRYVPSKIRVFAYLKKKNFIDPENLLKESSYSESLMCDIWIRSYLSLGKGKNEIIGKLQKKDFPKDLILQKIGEYEIDIYDWDTNRSHILNQIHTLQQRGKSHRMIASLMISRYMYFRDEIQDLLGDSDDSNNLQKEVQKYKNRYNIGDKKIFDKMIASLLRKGFSYSDIKNSISDINSIK